MPSTPLDQDEDLALAIALSKSLMVRRRLLPLLLLMAHCIRLWPPLV